MEVQKSLYRSKRITSILFLFVLFILTPQFYRHLEKLFKA